MFKLSIGSLADFFAIKREDGILHIKAIECKKSKKRWYPTQRELTQIKLIYDMCKKLGIKGVYYIREAGKLKIISIDKVMKKYYMRR